MKALLNGTVIAEAPPEDLVQIEGNWYFPPQSVNAELLEKSDTAYTCAWKGDAQYFTVKIGDTLAPDAAFSYPDPRPVSIKRIGRDYSSYIAFWKEVQIVE
ncbi:DUF427 domain-containing protein [Diaminobutyricimonas sp. TR449]|uniref:DUF427 domain-containing protein n=1 Tax=Diaminobutyricimonas sp. TR449 TaxID=2708076 RepID=UPI001424A158|nr:DUF427 domain-containing protein [Diaminobutyricimonas sp. TR449]